MRLRSFSPSHQSQALPHKRAGAHAHPPATSSPLRGRRRGPVAPLRLELRTQMPAVTGSGAPLVSGG